MPNVDKARNDLTDYITNSGHDPAALVKFIEALVDAKIEEAMTQALAFVRSHPDRRA